ncbi:MAG: DNA primase DnaG [Candidatus Hodarchaeales archaeon]|jgi:DNA primase
MVENIDDSSYADTVKYNIYIKFSIAGIAEKSDIIGAIFGQTEGLLGDSLDLRDLQRTSRIGRITVNHQYNKSQRKTTGNIIVPSSLDRIETAILAASLETVDRVGPCIAKIQLQKIEDVRSTKREQIVNRATQILKSWDQEVSPESLSLIEEVVKQARVSAISKWGPDKLPAGPGIKDSDTLVIVEGRADVLNLLKYGFRNVLAVEGTNIPKSIIPLTSQKRTIAFLDGDRGGDLILRELLELAEIDYVARAPSKQEVEDLTGKEVLKALRNRIPIEQVLKELEADGTADKEDLNWKARKQQRREKDRGRDRRRPDRDYAAQFYNESESIETKTKEEKEELETIPEALQTLVDQVGEFEALIVDSKHVIAKKIAVKDLRTTLIELTQSESSILGVIFDGVITQRLVDVAIEGKLEFIIGAQSGEIKGIKDLKIYEFKRTESK